MKQISKSNRKIPTSPFLIFFETIITFILGGSNLYLDVSLRCRFELAQHQYFQPLTNLKKPSEKIQLYANLLKRIRQKRSPAFTEVVGNLQQILDLHE